MRKQKTKLSALILAASMLAGLAACKRVDVSSTSTAPASTTQFVTQTSSSDILEEVPLDAGTSPLSDADALSIAAEIIAAEKGMTVDQLGKGDQADVLKKADELKKDAAQASEKTSSEAKITQVEPISIYFGDNSPIDLKVGETQNIEGLVYYLPQAATLKLLSFESEDTSIVTMDAEGTVTANKAGTARIKAFTYNGKAAYLTVNVADRSKVIPVHSISAANSNMVLEVGNTKGIGATVSPSDATDKRLTYQASDPAIATVDKNGLVRALKTGDTTIVVSSASGKALSVSIHVSAKTLVAVESIALSPDVLSLEVGALKNLSVKYSPSNVTDKSISYKSSNTSVATVDYSGTVRAVSEGSATITATAGGKTDTVRVTVTHAAMDVKLTAKSNAVVETGKTLDLSSLVNVTPSNEGANVKYTSKNAGVASVSGKTLTGISAGSTVVEARLGNSFSYIKVTVTEAATATPIPSDGFRSDIANEIFTLVNQERQAAGLSTLEYALGGQADADRRAKEISVNFAHTGNHWGNAENIAYGQKNATEAMNAWMNSSGHRAAIMGPNKASIAISVYSSNNKLYFVQLFSSKAATVPSAFHLSETKHALKVSESFSLSLTYAGGDDTTEVRWESNNGNVDVDSNGTVTALSAGTSKVYARVYHGGSLVTSYVCNITVEKDDTPLKPTPTPTPDVTPAPACPVCGSTEHTEHPQEPILPDETPTPEPEPVPEPEPEPEPEPAPEVQESQDMADAGNGKFGDLIGVIPLG